MPGGDSQGVVGAPLASAGIGFTHRIKGFGTDRIGSDQTANRMGIGQTATVPKQDLQGLIDFPPLFSAVSSCNER